MGSRRRSHKYDSPKFTDSELQSPRSSYYVPTRFSRKEAFPAGLPGYPVSSRMEPSATIETATALSTSGYSRLPTSLLHSGKLHKVGLQVASKISQSKATGKAKAEAPKPVKLQVTILEKGSSSAPLSMSLKELQKSMLETQDNLEKVGDVDSVSVLDIVRQWEYAIRRLAQHFERVEEQRIFDLQKAIDSDQKREQIHRQQLAAKDTEFAEAVEQCMAQLAQCDEHNTTMRESLKTHKERQLGFEKEIIALKESLEKSLPLQHEDIERHVKMNYEKALAHELTKKNEEMEKKLECQKDAVRKEMEEVFDMKTAAWFGKKQSAMPPLPTRSPSATPEPKVKQVAHTPKSVEHDANIEYITQLKQDLKKKDQEMKLRIDRQKEEMKAEFGKKIAALKQEYEKNQKNHIATATQTMPLSSTSSVPEIKPVAITPQLEASLTLQAMPPQELWKEEAKFHLRQQSTELSKTPEHTATGKRLNVTDSALSKRKPAADDDASTTTDAASLKRKRTADNNEPAAIDRLSSKRPRTMLKQSRLNSAAQGFSISASQPLPTASSDFSLPTSADNTFTDASDLVSNGTSTSRGYKRRRKLDIEGKRRFHFLGTSHRWHQLLRNPYLPQKLQELMKMGTTTVTKVEGLWSTSYHGLLRWKTLKDDMSEDEIHELSPIYNPPPPLVTYQGLPQWQIVDEDEEF
ncbi:hypothetical protein SLS60_000921 [Paraconiothyrium brasiliense]|uniref:Uncharacterized protein n=1 Tax=Paraconiothyrium brasiliense TaxID=300254 RepID=A0ABR3S7M5_9PLEO